LRKNKREKILFSATVMFTLDTETGIVEKPKHIKELVLLILMKEEEGRRTREVFG
jgi:hypothetical protein